MNAGTSGGGFLLIVVSYLCCILNKKCHALFLHSMQGRIDMVLSFVVSVVTNLLIIDIIILYIDYRRPAGGEGQGRRREGLGSVGSILRINSFVIVRAHENYEPAPHRYELSNA